jgi:hypothetical protein
MNQHAVDQRLNQLRDSLKDELRRLLDPAVVAEANSAIDGLFENLSDDSFSAIEARLIKATTKLWERLMRDESGRPIPVDHYIIEDGVEVALEDKDDPAQVTAQEVFEWIAKISLDSENEHSPAWLRRDCEGFEAALCSLGKPRYPTIRMNNE